GIIPKVLAKSSLSIYKQFEKKAERERHILKGAKFIIGRTDWDRRITRILSPYSQYFVGNEILRSGFYKNEWNKKQIGVTIQIVTICSDVIYKGFETIVSVSQILKENTDVKFEWKVIGLNEKSNIVRIVHKWKEVNFKNLNIQFLGSQNEQELIETLLKSDIYCQTSHIENSPNSLCEAMMLGMPIVATFAGGTSSIFENQKEGLQVQDGDPYSMAGAIIELIKDYELAKKLGANARLVAHKRHDKGKIVDTVISTYRTIISNECK
ncbi:MAG: glycosyltransferase, partial [Bacteroidia bacterium]|nr:glycosyltransferase [Bacteroidia bacterium]